MSLKVWLPLDGDLRNLGCSDIEVTNNGATVDNAGKIGKCYSFDGLNDYITITYSNFPVILAKNFSITFWVYSDDDGTRSIYFSNYGLSGSGNWFTLEKYTADEIRFWWNNRNPDKRFNNTKILSSDGWTHFTLTKNEGIIKTYLNGQLIETYINENLSSAVPSTATIFRIGGDSRTSGNLMFKGKMNDFRIYDHCLSAAEVKEIARGLVVHYKLDGAMGGTNYNLGNYSRLLNGASAAKTNSNWSKRGASTIVLTSENIAEVHAHADWQGLSLYSNQLNLQVGSTYTMSCYGYTNDSAGAVLSFYPMMYNSSGTRDTSSKLPISIMGNTFYRANSAGFGKVLTTEHKLFYASFIWNQTMQNILDADGYIELSFQIRQGTYTSDNIYALYLPKLEIGDHPTNRMPSCFDLGIDQTIVYDSSGYGHNGTINGTLAISNDAPRYSFSNYMPKTTTITHQRPIYGGTDQEWTCCMWVKLDTTSQSGQQLNNFNSGNNIVHTTNGTPLLYLNSGANDYYNYGNLTVSAGVWTHIAFVFKNSNATKLIYINGENHTNTSGPNKTSTPVGIPDIITVGTNLAGYISDYRVYCSALLDTDIQTLYNTRAKIDNLNQVHAFTLDENTTNAKITTKGEIKASKFSETLFSLYLKYDPRIYFEPDGSVWLHIYHHNNPSAGSFASTNDFVNGTYIDENRWFNVNVCNYLDKWEFMVKGRYTAEDNDWKIRWIQQVNPMTATWDQVAKETTTDIVTSGGETYDVKATDYGGLFAKKAATYLAARYGDTDNSWWGAIGAYGLYNNGIPGWGPSLTVTTTGFNDLYVRIDNVNFTIPTNASIKNDQIAASGFIEI